MLRLIKKLIKPIHTHPVVEGPFVFVSVPAPSLRDQLKLKKDKLVLRDSTKLPVSPRLGNKRQFKITEKLRTK